MKLSQLKVGNLPKISYLNLLGILIVIIVWWLISKLNLINNHVLPSPLKTWNAFVGLLTDNRPGRGLWENMWFSIKINLGGYAESILLALPIGFILGLNKTTRKMFEPIINSLRFIPITALGGVFVALSGLTIWTKINFLGFGIWVYLVPVVVQRISEVSEMHLQMMQTLGATKWQTFRYVTWNYVMSRLIDDVRILVGISWTYIIVAELKNVQGGLGSLIFIGERAADVGIVYAIVILIVLIGVFQDFLFRLIDRTVFKFKYE